MQPVNNKSLIAFLYGQMEKLDKGEVETSTVLAQCQLAKQINSQMRYELERANTIMKMAQFQIETGKEVTVREIESKNF